GLLVGSGRQQASRRGGHSVCWIRAFRRPRDLRLQLLGFAMKRRVLWLCVVVFFFACDAAGPAETQSRRQPLHLDTLSFSRLELPNTGYEDLYGAALAMTGDWLFVSAPGDDPFGP